MCDKNLWQKQDVTPIKTLPGFKCILSFQL